MTPGASSFHRLLPNRTPRMPQPTSEVVCFPGIKSTAGSALGALAWGALALSAPAQSGEVAPLAASDLAPGDDFGVMVAADGDVILARSRSAAYVFREQSGVYQFEQQFPSPEIQDNPGLGDSIAVHNDLIAVGYPQGDGEVVLEAPKGSVHLYRFDGLSWTFEDELISSDDALGTNFGDAVDIDGNTMIIGAPTTIKIVDLGGGQQSAFAQGSAFVFERQNGVWVETQHLPVPDDAQVGLRYGNAVGIDGDYLAVGAFFDKPVAFQTGSVYLFRKIAGLWTFLEKLTAPDPVIGAQYGRAVSVDGDRLVVGAPRADGPALGSGKAYLYDLSPAGADLVHQFAPESTSFGDSFGIDVDLQSADLVVGACYTDSSQLDTGALFHYQYVNGVWLESQKLESTQSSVAELLGWNVAVTKLGVAGGMLRNYGAQVGGPGEVRLFQPDGSFPCTPSYYGQVEGLQYDLTLSPSPAVLGQTWNSFVGQATEVPFAFLMVGPAPALIPVEDTAVLVDPTTYTLFTIPQFLDTYFVSLPIPADNPALVGKTFYLQAGTIESLANGGLALTPGLKLTLCP